MHKLILTFVTALAVGNATIIPLSEVRDNLRSAADSASEFAGAAANSASQFAGTAADSASDTFEEFIDFFDADNPVFNRFRFLNSLGELDLLQATVNGEDLTRFEVADDDVDESVVTIESPRSERDDEEVLVTGEESFDASQLAREANSVEEVLQVKVVADSEDAETVEVEIPQENEFENEIEAVEDASEVEAIDAFEATVPVDEGVTENAEEERSEDEVAVVVDSVEEMMDPFLNEVEAADVLGETEEAKADVEVQDIIDETEAQEEVIDDMIDQTEAQEEVIEDMIDETEAEREVVEDLLDETEAQEEAIEEMLNESDNEASAIVTEENELIQESEVSDNVNDVEVSDSMTTEVEESEDPSVEEIEAMLEDEEEAEVANEEAEVTVETPEEAVDRSDDVVEGQDNSGEIVTMKPDEEKQGILSFLFGQFT